MGLKRSVFLLSRVSLAKVLSSVLPLRFLSLRSVKVVAIACSRRVSVAGCVLVQRAGFEPANPCGKGS